MVRKKRKSGGDEVKLGRSSSSCVITSPSTYETVRTEDGRTDLDDDDVIHRSSTDFYIEWSLARSSIYLGWKRAR
jgi:hypothetical protein